MSRSWFAPVALAALTLLTGCKRQPELQRLGSIGTFSLTNQAGLAVSERDLAGKVWVAAFMFTRCPSICPMMTARMKSLQDSAKARGVALSLVSFSVDPEHDSAPVLKKYADDHGADLSNWSFLTGDYETVKRTSVDGFKLALDGRVDPTADHFGILHGSYLVLVDKAGQIRGYYRTTDDTLDQLLNDAARL